MAAIFTWTVSECERTIADPTDGITVAHWRVNATEKIGDTDYSATSYGTQSFTPDPTASDYIQYDKLTEADVIRWCQSALDKDAIESGLQASIDAQITPATATGTPW